MSTPLDYQTPQPPSGPGLILFWLIYVTCGLSSSFATVEIGSLWFGPAYVGPLIICLIALFIVAIVLDFALPLQRSLWQAAIPAVFAPPGGMILVLISHFI